VRLPTFEYELPRDLNEALELLKTYGPESKILAGGTDLLVRMKQGLTSPAHLISLKALPELTDISESGGTLRIGAAVRLADILACQPIRDRWPGLHEAVEAIGAPSIQHFRGTIGGNLCQDNRCQFYDQSKFFRGIRQACNKAGGKTCFAWEGGSDKCHSICQSDVAPILIAMDAQVIVQSTRGARTLPLAELYSGVGERPLTLSDDEMLIEIQVPDSGPGTGTAFEKLAYRSAIDYAVVSAGASVQTVRDRIVQGRLVIGAVSRAPLTISGIDEILKSKPAGDKQALNEAGKAAMNAAGAFIANNMAPPGDYRIQMAAVMAKRALRRATERALSGSTAMEEK
jgi:4-hydroxybenzoyl-CoA reductase subunit beta